jgi:hypothetical protein
LEDRIWKNGEASHGPDGKPINLGYAVANIGVNRLDKVKIM